MKSPDKSESSESVDRVIHEIDGIQEYDNKLPNWWLYTLYGAIVFGVGYWYWYQNAGIGQSPLEAYQAEMDRAGAEQAMAITVGDATPEALTALSKDPSAVALGKQVFASTCAACHRADGGGSVGPNLTDDFWLHGSAPDKIFRTIASGVPDKGMPAWQPQLGALKTQAVTAYVLGLVGTNVAGGKSPQGEREPISAR
ncbi:MAG: c-type cytochrome [Labilithrix sp.]|nr:c-type cytochrome [Labilithrix sp.]